MGRIRHPDPQPHQDQRTGRLTDRHRKIIKPSSTSTDRTRTCPASADTVLQVEVTIATARSFAWLGFSRGAGSHSKVRLWGHVWG